MSWREGEGSREGGQERWREGLAGGERVKEVWGGEGGAEGGGSEG